LSAPDDQFLVEFLLGRKLLSPLDAERLVCWWQAERAEGQDLVHFLVGKGVLSDAAPIMLDLMRDGAVAGDGSRLFREGTAETLRKLLPEPPPPPAAPQRVADISSVVAASTARPPAVSPSEPVRLEVGSTLGKCLLLEKVGQGAAGVVFRAPTRA
jgi:hypothetical protein